MSIEHLTAVLAHPAGWWTGPGGAGWTAGWAWIWPLTWLAFWAVAAGLVTWYLVAGRRRAALDSARRILAERYARGELSSEEYWERLEKLD
jgi:putative membrane protein